jgi:hypothetical protein
MPDPLSALREAAIVLLAAAPLPVVRATLRALLADTEPTAAQPPARAEKSPLRPPQGAKPTRPKAPAQSDGTWDARRREIRAAMIERQLSYPALAQQFGVATRTLHHALGRRQPPTVAMRQRLEAWLDAPAPEVAAEPPFRLNGAGRGHATADVAVERATAS